MYHTKYAARLHPENLSATFEGEGESPEQARRSCEAQLATYLSRIRQDNPREEAPVVKAFTCVDTDYEGGVHYPRIALRKSQTQWVPRSRRGIFSFLHEFFSGGTSLPTR